MTDLLAPSRARRLKARTHEAHERLDARIMSGRPFEDRERYARFLIVQCAFHRDIDTLYSDPRLVALLPGLPERRRLKAIEQDLGDLGVETSGNEAPPVFTAAGIDIPVALGWLYVAEGSNLGAALLRKEAAKLGLSDDFGARHLAGHPEGRAAHWRAFVAALDAAVLNAEEEEGMTVGAEAAFARVHALADAAFA